MSDERKRSWREIDQAKIRGVKAEKSLSKDEVRAQKLAARDAKAGLDALFANSKLTQDKVAALEAIKSFRGKPEYIVKMNDYLSEYGIPLEWDAQLLFLDHRDSKVVIEVLDQLKKTAPKESLSRQDVLGQKLKVMMLSTFDGRIIDKIKELQESILKI